MAQFLTIAKVVLSLFPLIIQAVQSIEQAFPQSGQGAAKLDAVKNTLATVYQVANDTSVQFEQIWPAISGAVAGIVSLAKAVKA